MGDAGVGMLDGAHFAFVNVDAVSGDHFGVKDAALLDIGDDGHPEFLADRLDFAGCFGQVNVEWHVILDGQVRTGLQDLIGAGIGCVGGNCWDDQRVAFPGLNEFFGCFERFFIGSRIWRGEFQDGLRADRPQSGVRRGLGDIRFKIVHIHKGGHTAAD